MYITAHEQQLSDFALSLERAGYDIERDHFRCPHCGSFAVLASNALGVRAWRCTDGCVLDCNGSEAPDPTCRQCGGDGGWHDAAGRVEVCDCFLPVPSRCNERPGWRNLASVAALAAEEVVDW